VTGLQVRAVVESRCVDVEFEVAPGEVLAVLGPNGAGKSTVMHVIAGLLRPDRGTVRVGERLLTDEPAGRFVPTYDRRVALLLQDPLLFPHLSVESNVAFAPRSTHRRRGVKQPGERSHAARAREVAAHWLAEVDATDLARRMPRALSGGQAQRVALARALAAEPDVMLLDEPMAGLDVGTAAAMRKVLRGVLARDGRAAVLVSHDMLDVLALATRMMVIESGRIAEIGLVTDLLAAPRSTFGARFAGVNLVNGRAAACGALTTEWGVTWYGSRAGDVATGEHAVAVFAPSAVAVYRDKPHGSPRNTVEATVAELDARGPAIRIRTEEQPDGAPGLAADVTAEAAIELGLAPGDRVFLSVKSQEIAVHPGT
jgi:molybdate transport system ATP-binding protein